MATGSTGVRTRFQGKALVQKFPIQNLDDCPGRGDANADGRLRLVMRRL
jgi:hypothetical protein